MGRYSSGTYKSNPWTGGGSSSSSGSSQASEPGTGGLAAFKAKQEARALASIQKYGKASTYYKSTIVSKGSPELQAAVKVAVAPKPAPFTYKGKPYYSKEEMQVAIREATVKSLSKEQQAKYAKARREEVRGTERIKYVSGYDPKRRAEALEAIRGKPAEKEKPISGMISAAPEKGIFERARSRLEVFQYKRREYLKKRDKDISAPLKGTIAVGGLFGAGVLKGFVELAQMAFHPIKTTKGLFKAALTPIQTGKAFVSEFQRDPVGFAGEMAGFGKGTSLIFKGGKLGLKTAKKAAGVGDIAVQDVRVVLSKKPSIKTSPMKGVTITRELPRNMALYDVEAVSKVSVRTGILGKTKDLGFVKLRGGLIAQPLKKDILIKLKGKPTQLQEMVAGEALRKGEKGIGVGKFKISMEGKELGKATITGLTTKVKPKFFKSITGVEFGKKFFVAEQFAKRIDTKIGVGRKVDMYGVLGRSQEATKAAIKPKGELALTGGYQFVISPTSKVPPADFGMGRLLKTTRKDMMPILSEEAITKVTKEAVAKDLGKITTKPTKGIVIPAKGVKFPAGEISVESIQDKGFGLVGGQFPVLKGRVDYGVDFPVTKLGATPQISTVAVSAERLGFKTRGAGALKLDVTPGLKEKDLLKDLTAAKTLTLGKTRAGLKVGLREDLRMKQIEGLRQRMGLRTRGIGGFGRGEFVGFVPGKGFFAGLLPLDSDIFKPAKKGKKRKAVSFIPAYTPSLEATTFDIKGAKPPEEVYRMGLGLRPITRRSKAKTKKRGKK